MPTFDEFRFRWLSGLICQGRMLYAATFKVAAG